MRHLLNGNTVANEIRMLRLAHRGAVLLVEGDTDARLFKGFVHTSCRVIPAHGKENAVHAMQDLRRTGYSGILAIVDADFDPLEGIAPGSPDVLYTDTHDLETMIIASPALDHLLVEHLPHVNTEMAKEVRQALLQAGVEVGYLRWASFRGQLGVRFQGLAFQKFVKIVGTSVRVDVQRLGEILGSREGRETLQSLLKEVARLKTESHDPWLICCGHDAAQVLAIYFKKRSRAKRMAGEDVERELRLAYRQEYFASTRLCTAIDDWTARHSLPVLAFRSRSGHGKQQEETFR